MHYFDHPLLLTLLPMIITLVVVSTAAILLRNRSSKRHRLPPGSFGWPILGETLEFLGQGRAGNPDAFIRQRTEKYKSTVFKTSLTGSPVVFLCSRDGHKFLFGNENKLVQLWWPPSAKKLLGNALSNRTGEEARQIRKMLHYFVSPEALMKLYIKSVDRLTQLHINTHWKGKEGLLVFPAIKSYTFQLACHLFMSLEDPDHISRLAKLFNLFVKGVISIPVNVPGTRFYRATRAIQAVRKELLILLQQRKQALENKTASPSQDLLSHLLSFPDENGKFMPESDIVNNVLLLLFAGHDTSSVAITLLLKILAEQPQIYQNVLKEQAEIASSKGEGEFLQWEDIQKMKYSWNVVCEVMRLYPPIMGTFREALVDFSYGGYDIPKGWKLYWSPFSTQQDDDLFPDSARFDPTRFEGSGPTPYSYVPFGGGPRMCIGKEYARVEILVFLHNLMRDFRWSLAVPDERITYDPMPIPVRGLPIRLHQHHQTFDNNANNDPTLVS